MTDLPGVQRPRDALTERMQRRVEREIADSDAVLFVVNAEQGVGPGRPLHLEGACSSRASTRPVVCAVNKVDRLNNAETAAVLAAVGEIGGVDEIFPVSARKGHGLEPMVSKLVELLPESPFLFPPEQRSDLPSEVLLAELIREQVLRRTRDELPHAVEVQVSEVAHREDGVVEVHAHVWAEAESQKGILIGSGGRKIKEIGTAARTELERELGGRVFLDLQVRVRKRWRKDEGLLDRSASSERLRDKRRPQSPPRILHIPFTESASVVSMIPGRPTERNEMDIERDRRGVDRGGRAASEGKEKPMPVQEEGLAVGLEGEDGSDVDIDPEIAAEVDLQDETRRGREGASGPLEDAIEDPADDD